MFVQIDNRIHLCFINTIHCLNVKGVFLDYAERILGSIYIVFIPCWNQHIKTIILSFSLKKYLALALLLCALLSLANAQCFHQAMKPGKRKEKTTIYTEIEYVYGIYKHFLLENFQNWCHIMNVLKNIYRRDPMSGQCGWHMASCRIFMAKQWLYGLYLWRMLLCVSVQQFTLYIKIKAGKYMSYYIMIVIWDYIVLDFRNIMTWNGCCLFLV